MSKVVLPQKQLRLFALVPDADGDIYIQVEILFVEIGLPAAVAGNGRARGMGYGSWIPIDWYV